MQIGN